MIFNSDNQTGASAQVLAAIVDANTGATKGYGNDPHSQQAVDKLREVFECPQLEAYFVATGTVANCLALASITRPWNTILCHGGAHIAMDESTAPEFFTNGARITPITQAPGKITADQVSRYFQNAATDVPHNPQPGVLSITQASEAGLVYSPDEISALSTLCKANNLSLHMDGARFANAVASLGCSPADITHRAGVDVLCLGATKCGALTAEAVVFFNPEQAQDFVHHRKRTGHLVSKSRLFGAQFNGWLANDHWLELAAHANTQAQRLQQGLASITGVKVVWPVQANQLFVTLPAQAADALSAAGAQFYDWYPTTLPADISLADNERYIRLVTSFETGDEQVEEFVQVLKNASA